ncbi:hypothetical protein F4808DRAFT_37408 [Astrocystis sublimbata]|nr:hypothetical protein F4808DRAFT_37408 [Astrocystis sublimbata]
MQFTTFIAAVSALAMGANAATFKRDGLRLAQFRVYLARGCNELNDGFYTVDESDANTCHELPADSGLNVASVVLEELLAGTDDLGCTFNLFTDKSCSADKFEPDYRVCAEPEGDDKNWGSWSITCTNV